MAVKKGKKVSKKKVTKKTVEAPKEKRLDQAEMRKLEDLHNEANYSRSQMQVHDQYVANVKLKIELQKAEMKLLEHEMKRVEEVRAREAEKFENTHRQLKSFGNELKLKYGIDSNEQIKYDFKSGKLVK